MSKEFLYFPLPTYFGKISDTVDLIMHKEPLCIQKETGMAELIPKSNKRLSHTDFRVAIFFSYRMATLKCYDLECITRSFY